MVLTYLVHHGYSQTAESFARCVGEEISEELASMRSRQHIQRLVMAGHIGEAIKSVDLLYPGLLAHNQDLHFKLKVTSRTRPLSISSSYTIPDRPFAGSPVYRDGERRGHGG